MVTLLSSLLSIPVAMLIVTLSQNRVEGMAIGKIAGLVLFGLPAPFFIEGNFQYLLSWLPSFWTAKVFTTGSTWVAIPAIW